MDKVEGISYQDAGVSIEEADRAVASIKRMARSTFTKGVLTEIGSFGACFELPKMRKPVLISSMDGVGTKLKIAFLTGKHDTVGEDLVNHCANDIAVQGALPLYFLDYFAVGKLDARVAVQVVAGMARACKKNGCALIGGETAEMPGLYNEGEYDLAGTIVGVAERKKLLTGEGIKEGYALIALPSTGLHTNGYSLARKLIFDVAKLQPDSYVADLGRTVAEELLTVHRSYLKPLRALHDAKLLAAAAHITGGGITANLPRVLPDGLGGQIELSAWKVPAVFELLRGIGNVPEDDWRRTFNLGIGMIFVVPAKKAAAAESLLKKLKEQPMHLGEVIRTKRGQGRVVYR